MSHRKVLLNNFLSLSGVQIASYALPLITVPYMVRVLGPGKFGLIAFAQALIQYFTLLTDYGFGLSATKEVSVNRSDAGELSKIFSSVMIIKAVFMIVSFLVMIAVVFSFEKFRSDWPMYILTFGLVAGNVLFPVWYFQGMEKMNLMAALNILPRVIATACIFIFVHRESDYLYVPLVNSLGAIVGGVAGLYVCMSRLGARFGVPSFAVIRKSLRQGWDIFVSTIAISLYTTSNTFLLGLFTSTVVVGYYSAADKIIRAVQGLIGPFAQTIYPHMSELASQSKEAAVSFVRRAAKILGIPAFLGSVLLCLFAPLVTRIVLGNQYGASIPVLQILSFVVFIIFINNLLGVQVMLNFGYEKEFRKIVVIAGLFDVALVCLLASKYQHIGVAVAVLATEIYITVHEFVFLKRQGIALLDRRPISVERFRGHEEKN